MSMKRTKRHGLDVGNSDGLPRSGGDWFARPANIQRFVYGLYFVCAVLVLADWVYEDPHPYFAVEKIYAFQAWFGFAAFVVIVYLGKLLRLIVRRPEDYYDR